MPQKLSVIFRDDSPTIHFGDSPSYRSVQIELTPEQQERMKPRPTYRVGTTQYYEAISKCFIEPEGA